MWIWLRFYIDVSCPRGFPGSSVLKNPLANAGDVGDVGLIPGSGRSPGGGNGNPLQMTTCSSVLAWEIPWTEEPSSVQFMGSKLSHATDRLSMHEPPKALRKHFPCPAA